MAEEASLDLEKIGEITDPDELRKIAEAQRQSPVTATTEAAEAETPDIGQRPADGELAPPVEAKPAEEVKAPVETKPADTPPAPQDNAAWKRVRLLEKQLADMQKSRETTPPAEAPKSPPAFDDDPANFLKAKAENLEAEVNRLRAEQANKDRLDGIRNQEAEFKTTKPDYPDALKFLEQAEIKDWERAGLATVGLRSLGAAIAAGRQGNEAYKPYVDHLAKVAAQPAVQEEAAKTNQDPEDVAQYLIARDTYLASRRQLVWQGAEATGRNPAAIAYDLALARGYTPAQAEAAAKSVDDGAASREKVLKQKAISEATNSLSESKSGETGAQPRVLRNRSEVVGLNDADLDAMIANPQSYRNI
jgi:hypothetical protein